jgi:hypothetical protein
VQTIKPSCDVLSNAKEFERHIVVYSASAVLEIMWRTNPKQLAQDSNLGSFIKVPWHCGELLVKHQAQYVGIIFLVYQMSM